MIVPIRFDKTSEWCNSFSGYPKQMTKKIMSRPSKAPIQRVPVLNDILPRLIGVKNGNRCELMVSQFKIDDKSSYLTTFHVSLVGSDTSEYHFEQPEWEVSARGI